MELSSILFIFFVLLILNYILRVGWSRLSVRSWEGQLPEGFTDLSGNPSMAEASQTQWIGNPDLFDSFYAQVYDQLFQGSTRLQAETGLALHAFKSNGISLKDMRILDAGCGTGIVSTALAKMNVEKVIAVDSSSAMLNRAKTVTLPSSTLTPEQKAKIEFRNSDLLNPSTLAPGEVTNAVVFYFVLYYLRDIETFFRNMYVWVKPGGMIAVEVVNKYKFDPMLDSAAPWVGFSLQKYSKERITDSKVVFDKFTYEGKFDLIDPVAEFREIFRFKDGSVRRQRHTLYMPSIEEITKIAKIVGWEYKSYVDLTSIGFEYAYLLLFTHP